MKKETAMLLLNRVDKAETILDNIANEFNLDSIPKELNDVIEAAWRAAQKARIATQEFVKSIN